MYYLLGGSSGERRLMSLRMFPECRSEQKWTAGQTIGSRVITSSVVR